MNYLKLIGLIVVSLILITLLVEIMEFLLVAFTSGYSLNELPQDQKVYFSLRNTTAILIAKPVYTFLVAFGVSYLCTKFILQIKTYFIALAIVQGTGILYGAFLSEFKDSLPTWYWMLILSVISVALGTSYLLRAKNARSI